MVASKSRKKRLCRAAHAGRQSRFGMLPFGGFDATVETSPFRG